jgi:hypothetical protein
VLETTSETVKIKFEIERTLGGASKQVDRDAN